jgi:hypothetical protein
MESKRHAHRLYLGENGWTPNPEGAQLRLDASLRTVVAAQPKNQLHRPDGKGGWIAITQEEGLSAIERGLVWFGWQTAAQGEQYLAFKGVRVLDETVITQLFKDLKVRDEDGQVVESPAGVGHIFLLSIDDARLFHTRVQEAGGQIHRGDPIPNAATVALQSLEKTADALDELGSQDESFLAEARAGDFSGQAAFERRYSEYEKTMQQAMNYFQEGQRALAPLTAPGRSLQDNAHAQALLGRLGFALERCTLIQEQREASEKELAELIARSSGILSEREYSPARLLMFREMGLIAREQGFQVEDTSEGVRILTQHGWMALGPDISFE